MASIEEQSLEWSIVLVICPMDRLDASKCSTKSLLLSFQRNSLINLYKIWIKNALGIDMFVLVVAMTGPFSLRGAIQVSVAMAVEDSKAAGGKDQADVTILVGKDAQDGQSVVAKQQTKRKGICSLSDWREHEQHG